MFSFQDFKKVSIKLCMFFSVSMYQYTNLLLLKTIQNIRKIYLQIKYLRKFTNCVYFFLKKEKNILTVFDNERSYNF